jgi:hypothetical protein
MIFTILFSTLWKKNVPTKSVRKEMNTAYTINGKSGGGVDKKAVRNRVIIGARGFNI